MPRLILVSNRLPVTIHRSDGEVAIRPSHGGLATGLRMPHQESGGPWIGWPGDVSSFSDAERHEVDRKLAELRLVPLFLDADEHAGFYEGFSNRILWPLFHYQLDHIPLESMEWEVYSAVNRRFADEVVRHYRDGDLIWVHDYHLCLVPAMLRERLPQARIGFFLHIPFPSSEVIQALPWRGPLLEGILGADLVGFHTDPYARHFQNSLTRLLGLEGDINSVGYQGRRVRVGAFPMGIDAARFAADAVDPEIERFTAELRGAAGEQRILVGVDRLDYTKGIRRRMLALDRLLTREPRWKERLRFIQIAVPSRTGIDEYDEFRSDVDEMVGRVNGAHATTRWVPIHYLCRSFSARELTAFYCAADVMLVTPLRDGLNLVSKEFIASRVDERGVLVLSELAGAAAELGEALMVNPYDVDGMGAAIGAALDMSVEEQRARMRPLRRRVLADDVHHWVQRFLGELGRCVPQAVAAPTLTGSDELARMVKQIRSASARLFLLDCDGTLVRFQREPAKVGVDAELRRLLVALAALPRTSVQIVSGRARESLGALFADLPVGLHAEHAFFWRASSGDEWIPASRVDPAWKLEVRPLLDALARRTPGAFVEEKATALAWHFRKAEARYGRRQANDLLLLLRESLSNLPVSVLAGDHVIEVRQQNAHKGLAVARSRQGAPNESQIVAFGDDATDEDLFAALPAGAISVHVGERASSARYRVADVEAARRLLAAMI